MAETLTPQQLEAVNNTGGSLLVSAAAGSGKTKVLVDRLLRYLTDPISPANLDDFLIITYTKAAAAELRGKIASKLNERLAAEPENRHLQQQLQRLYLTKISTVHSFCADILREYAYQLDLAADFRVADESECVAMQAKVLQQLLDKAYENASDDQDFCEFIDSQGFGRDDRQIPEIILRVYHSAKCHLAPDQWLDWCISSSSSAALADPAETIWGAYLVADLHRYLDLQIDAMQKCVSGALASPNMEKPAAVLAATLDQLRMLRNCKTWDQIRQHMKIDYGTLRFSSKILDVTLSDQIKAVREACKGGLAKKLRRFADDSVQISLDNEASGAATRGLIALVRQFDAEYGKWKRSRHILDFSDLEHSMLDLLLGKHRSGRTAAAKEIGLRFREVMVDEYQDSNAVQDAIFGALTADRQNCFMVGDVKQSIYQFRLADPGIFLEKYNTFADAADAKDGEGRKVLLSSNFRSGGAVISAVNDVFSTCMSEEVGGLVYGEDEFLNEGVPHDPLNEPEVQLYGIKVANDTYQEEAAFVANQIHSLLDGTHFVRGKEGCRPITAEDIVILLRSPGSVGMDFRYALERHGIRCNTGANADLLQSEEIQVLCSLLQVISNPLQDIPLVAVLSSRIFGFTADDLAAIRSACKKGSIYDALLASELPKVCAFLDALSVLRKSAQINSLSKLLLSVFAETRMDSIYGALPDGDVRVENLQNFFQIAVGYESTVGGRLMQFLDHLELLSDRGLAKPGEDGTGGAVTIMSIHKSKGLEFPVVFLCGLSRGFNQESARAQVLCDKELGLGLTCVDAVKRVRYPSMAKRAIATKIIADGLSEEMRVLYVAMTRARDRLIMTYASPNVEAELEEMALRMALSKPLLMTMDANCPGYWVLQTAIARKHQGWAVQIVKSEDSDDTCGELTDAPKAVLAPEIADRIAKSLSFGYGHSAATKTPSKQTATQLKGRSKDQEAAENSAQPPVLHRTWRKPKFVQEEKGGTFYGTAMHQVMQYISFPQCTSMDSIKAEVDRLVEQGYISKDQAVSVNLKSILSFFSTDLGRRLQCAKNPLREFKFSVLDDAAHYCPEVHDEKVLLQGVVDCAWIEDDGIVIIDFKTDRVTEDNMDALTEKYRPQLLAYAKSLESIFQMPVKSALLYFFGKGEFVSVI